MSGRRRITVDEAQWSTLQRQARQLRDLQINAPQLVADLQRQTQSELARVSERLEGRQRSVEQAMGALSDQTRALEEQTNRQLREQAGEMNRRLAQTAGKLREQTDAALARQQQAWRAELSAEREHQRAALDHQRAALARLESQVRDQAQASSRAAETWLHDAGLVHDLIRDELPHERYAPGQLAALDRRLATAKDNASQGQSQAALAVAQEAYHELSELRLEIELRDREWTGLHTVAYEAVLRLDGLAAENARQAIAAGAAGNEDPFELDVDYWSEGALTKLRAELADLLARVDNTDAPPSADDLRDVAEVQVPELERQLSDIVQRAHLRVFASQLRANVADMVAHTLDQVAGYIVDDGLYEHLDQRRTFLAKLKHANGNEIVVSVAPPDEDSGQYMLRLMSYDYDTTSEEELEERARAVTAQLRARGIPADDRGCEDGVPDRAYLDFGRMRELAPPEQSRATATETSG
jgi:hypothetical protein